jgi:hypothetical protein
LRVELYDKVNALGIGAQGLGGLSTVLDVKILDYPTHAAGKPVGMIPNCAATRHAHFTLDGRGAVKLDPPDLARWPDVHWAPSPSARRVNLDTLTPAEVAMWKPGETLLLNGRMLTGRDAAHKRIADLFARGEKLPPGVDFTNRVIYYVGPVDPVRDEVVGPSRADDVDADGQVHRDDARQHRASGDDRQSGARAGGDRGDQKAQGGLSDGGRRRSLSRVQSDQELAGDCLRRSRDGGDLRVRRQGHAGDGRPSTRGAIRSITPHLANGNNGSARYRLRPFDAAIRADQPA